MYYPPFFAIFLLVLVAGDGWCQELPPKVAPPVITIELDEQLLRSTTRFDIPFLNALRKRSGEDESAARLIRNLRLPADSNEEPRLGKLLAFHRSYQLDGKQRYVLIYDPNWHLWPGTQPQTIVISDGNFRLLQWKEVGGSPKFSSADLQLEDGKPRVRITCLHRHTHLVGGEFTDLGRYVYSLENDKVQSVDMEWLLRNEPRDTQARD
jgi:hypothetical protein